MTLLKTLACSVALQSILLAFAGVWTENHRSREQHEVDTLFDTSLGLDVANHMYILADTKIVDLCLALWQTMHFVSHDRVARASIRLLV